jgi:hypothetical protein
MNRESSSEFAIRMGRTRSIAEGTKVAPGSKNAPGINAGRAGFWQHEMEHVILPFVPPKSCSQSIGEEL